MKRLALLLAVGLLSFAVTPLVPAQKGDKGKAAKKTEKKPTALDQARQRLLKGNYEEARSEFEALRGDAPFRTGAVVGLANSWREVGEYAKAMAVLNDAIGADADPDLKAARADLNYELGKWDEAMKEAEAVIAKKPEHFLARWVRARILRDKGDLATADTEVRWFVRTYTRRSNEDRDVTDPDELLIVAQAGAENARWHNLPQQFRFILNDVLNDALQSNPDFWPAEAQAGFMLMEKYNRPDATDAFDKALRINAKAAEALAGKAAVALHNFEVKEAENLIEQALAVNPKLPMALQLKADVQFLMENPAAAQKTLEAARLVNPRDEGTLGRLAACLHVQKKEGEFAALVKEVEGFDSKPGVFYQELAECLENRKLYAAAETYFKKAIDLRPNLLGPRNGLGLLYMRLGKEAEAKTVLTKAFDNDRFNIRVANSLKVLRHLENYKTLETPHYEIRYDPKSDKLLIDFFAEYMEEVHEQLQKDFGYEPPGKTLVEVFNSHEFFSGRTVALPDLHTIGACTGRLFTMASPKAKGVVRPFNWGRVVRHELVHVFNLSQTEFMVPHWLTEGLAVRNEGFGRLPAWMLALRDRFVKNDLLNLDNITLAFVRPKDQSEWSLAYCQSNLYVEYLIQTHGLDKVGKLLDAYRQGMDTGEAIKKVCGVDKEAFEKGYKEYVKGVLEPYLKAKGIEAKETPMTLAELEEAFNADPDDAEVASRLAEQYQRRKRPQDARRLVDGVLKKTPGHPLASIVWSRLLSSAGDDEAAKQALEAAQAANPDDARILLALGRLHVEAKDYDKAIPLFEHGRKVAPLEGPWLQELARIYMQAEQADELKKVLKELITQDPDDLASRIRLTQMLLEADQPAEAEKVAREMLQIDVTNEEVQKLFMQSLTDQKKEAEIKKYRKRFGEEI
jgi:tetratricopeptide (TPR) repeat protein